MPTPLPGQPGHERYAADFNRCPYLVIWETTRACDLACVHCRAEARPFRNPNELSTVEAILLMEEIARFGEPVVVLTGGDPLKRPDIFGVIRHGADLGLRMTMTPSGTPLMTPAAIAHAKDSGLKRLAVSLDGSSASRHDAFRQVPGSFYWSVKMLEQARQIGLSTQVNTTVSRHTLGDLDAIFDLVQSLGVSLWSVFFLVPIGRSKPKDAADEALSGGVDSVDQQVNALDFERVFAKMYEWAKYAPFDIKSTAAPHYRRFVLQQRVRESRAGGQAPQLQPPLGSLRGEDAARPDGIARAPRAVNDGNGLVFVSHTGDIYPSGFLPLSAGNVRHRSLVATYREDPLFKRLRDYDQLLGKCGMCEFRNVCGGSRARAYATTHNLMEAEPLCCYLPPAWVRHLEKAEAEASPMA